MARYLGFDGFRGGWVAAWIDDGGRHGFSYAEKIADLLTGRYARAMIDIPIGLPEAGYRKCDRQARGIVGASVFVGVRRSLLAFDTFEQANKSYWAKGEPGISLQLWHIKDKIAEVDRLMTPRRQRKLGETHPEVIFHGLGKGKRLESKKSPEGRAQRIGILKKLGFTTIEAMLDRRSGTGIGRDDLIDACACAIAARDAAHVLGGDERDRRGLRMEINY